MLVTMDVICHRTELISFHPKKETWLFGEKADSRAGIWKVYSIVLGIREVLKE